MARYRDELAAGHTPADAATRTWASAGRTILFSGLIVIAALSGLLTFSVPRLQTLGAAGISATFVAVLASLTFTAAMLGLWGSRITPSTRAVQRARRGDAAVEQGFFARLARATQRRPAVALVLSGVVLTLALPALTTNARLPQVEALPRDVMESARAADLLRDEFDIAVQPAIEVLARSSPAELDGWASAWRSDPAVTGVERAVATSDNLSRVVIEVAGDGQGPDGRWSWSNAYATTGRWPTRGCSGTRPSCST